MADPGPRRVHLWRLIEGQYVESERSALLDVAAADLTAGIAWL